MNSSTIESLLKARGAWLKSQHGEEKLALDHADLSKLIAAHYASFEILRDKIFKATEEAARELKVTAEQFSPEDQHMLRLMSELNMIEDDGFGSKLCNAKGKRYLSGGWLEELAWLAALAAGADEATYGQVIGWEVKGYTGENEIDLIMRLGERLAFVSCKAFRSELDMSDRKHRHRLMDAVHEADNLCDHFGRNGERVAVIVTTDLFDEIKNSVRYNALMGKAAVLDVRIIALEEMGWDALVKAMAQLLEA
jgi:Domain of unknown function (DUF1887)